MGSPTTSLCSATARGGGLRKKALRSCSEDTRFRCLSTVVCTVISLNTTDDSVARTAITMSSGGSGTGAPLGFHTQYLSAQHFVSYGGREQMGRPVPVCQMLAILNRKAE